MIGPLKACLKWQLHCPADWLIWFINLIDWFDSLDNKNTKLQWLMAEQPYPEQEWGYTAKRSSLVLAIPAYHRPSMSELVVGHIPYPPTAGRRRGEQETEPLNDGEVYVVVWGCGFRGRSYQEAEEWARTMQVPIFCYYDWNVQNNYIVLSNTDFWFLISMYWRSVHFLFCLKQFSSTQFSVELYFHCLSTRLKIYTRFLQCWKNLVLKFHFW